MCDWSEFKFNEPYEGTEISSILGVPLPSQYIEFMKSHNGGEGDIGGITWLMLDRLETLQELNEAIKEFLPDRTIIIGSDGSSELYGVNADGIYLNLPETMEEEYIAYLGNNLNELPQKIFELWNNM